MPERTLSRDRTNELGTVRLGRFIGSGVMGNFQPKSVGRFDEDADFGASFVLSAREVDEALASAEAEPPSEATSSPNTQAAARRKKWLYAGIGAVLALLAGAVAILAG